MLELAMDPRRPGTGNLADMTQYSGPSTATGMLRDEHQLILKVVDVLDEALQSSSGGETSLDFDVIDGCISFFRLFADACHHGKEEDLLFPELIEQGMPGDEGPIAVMLEEHRLGRHFVRGMAQAAPAARTGEEQAEASLRANADDYMELIRAHIGKEDGILFEIADNLVVGEVCRTLCADYDRVCQGRFEGRTLEDLEQLASNLMSG